MNKKVVTYRELVALNSSLSAIYKPHFYIKDANGCSWVQTEGMPDSWQYVRVNGHVYTQESIMKHKMIKTGKAKDLADKMGI